jgi:NADP-dependent 3-hydroxy acid dehydrogenase YdfG
MGRLAGKSAFIMVGISGIGEAAIRPFLQESEKMAFIDQSEEKVPKLKQNYTLIIDGGMASTAYVW